MYTCIYIYIYIYIYLLYLYIYIYTYIYIYIAYIYIYVKFGGGPHLGAAHCGYGLLPGFLRLAGAAHLRPNERLREVERG